MDSIKGFFTSMYEYTTLSDRRNEQLAKERELDTRLHDCYKECPNAVFSYVMKARKHNREMSSKIYDGPMHQSPSRYKEYLDAMDDVQDITVECPRQMCDQIKDKVKAFEQK